MVSSFEASPDDLMQCAVAVATALQIKHPSPFCPVAVMNEYDEFFGNSVNVVHKYQEEKSKRPKGRLFFLYSYLGFTVFRLLTL